MPPRRSSSGMQSIRRELQRRRPRPLASKTSAAKKTSAPPPPPESTRYMGREPRPCPQDPSSTASKFRRPRPAATSPTMPSPPLSAPSSAGSACPSTLVGTEDEHLRPGTAVGVRTRTTTLKTGQVLVLWLRAMVVSRAHGGYEVVYDGSWPPGDPHGTVHVPRRQVRLIKSSSPSPTTPPPSGAPSPCVSSAATATMSAVKKKEIKPAPRPTRAGKSLLLIRSLLPEMERQAPADFHGY